MADKCVPKNHCGTNAAGWMTGSHPSQAEGVVSRRVCYSWGSTCCSYSNNIRVRNCGGFYVYELQKPPQCALRYCGGNPIAPTIKPKGECNNYKTLNTADRSMSYSGDGSKCDRGLIIRPGWYRFSGEAGSSMADKCVPKNHCGTNAAGWMTGSHPSQAEGVVSRRVCYSWGSTCCSYSNNIRVRNCGGFYVYELQKPPQCALRYCGGNPIAPGSYDKVGCYKDDEKDRSFPELVLNLRSSINYHDLKSSVIDKCAKAVYKKGYKYFGIQYYGECWSGPDDKVDFKKHGKSGGCPDGIGHENENMVYKIKA